MNRLFGPFCQSALHTAARFGREDLAALLIARGADVNVRIEPREETPLHLAAMYGRASVAALLLSRGANVDADTTFGRTPLHEAAFGQAGTSDVDGRVEVARLLISHGADVNARERGSGFTPLDQTTTGTLNRGANEPLTELLLAAGAKPRTEGSQGDSALHRAASQGDLAIVQRLLDHGADPNAIGRDTTPLGDAAYQGHAEIVALLLDRGADANRSVSGSRFEGSGTPLAMALMPMTRASERERSARRLQVARMLLDHGAATDAQDPRGRTVLHRAAASGDLAAVDLLLARRAAVDPADALGWTPLHLAIKEGHVTVAARLLDKGADARAMARVGTRPIDLSDGDRQMQALVRRYADRQRASDRCGIPVATALHVRGHMTSG